MSTFSRTSKSSSEIKSKEIEPVELKLFSYDDIPLRLFLEIANTSAYDKLIISGGDVSMDVLIEAWEAIVQRNSSENSSFQYQSYLSLYKGYSLLMCQHIQVALLFQKAALQKSEETVNELKKFGFTLLIDAGDDEYYESLMKASKKSNSLVTKLRMKKNEFEEYSKRMEQRNEGFEEIIGNLEFALGWAITTEITLARYNVLKKLAKKKSDALTKKK